MRGIICVLATAACLACSGGGSGKPDGGGGNCGTCNKPDECCLVGASYFCLDVTAGDRNNCGGCDVVCSPTTTDHCANDTCKCGFSDPCTGGTQCCPGTGGTQPTCVNTTNDENNCGSCGNACGANGTCVDSQCTCGGTTCGAGTICCPGGCVSDTTDFDCGGCGIACTGGDTCQGNPPQCQGGGTTTCTPGSTDDCGGVCQDICSDGSNCGGCNQACNVGDLCFFGLCFDTFNAVFYQAGPSLDCVP